jgi:hypothetical protein
MQDNSDRGYGNMFLPVAEASWRFFKERPAKCLSRHRTEN